MSTKTDIVCTVFGSTVSLWIHSLGTQLGYTILVGGLSGFSAWFGTQFAKYCWAYVKVQFKRTYFFITKTDKHEHD